MAAGTVYNLTAHSTTFQGGYVVAPGTQRNIWLEDINLDYFMSQYGIKGPVHCVP